jgi:C1A family cysteine protease
MNKINFFLFLLITLEYITSSEFNSEKIDHVLEKFMDKSPQELYKIWHQQFKKNYKLETDEAKYRFSIFLRNLNEIKEHNSKNHSYQIGLNQFSDLTNEEFTKKMGNVKNLQGQVLENTIKKMNLSNFSFKENRNLRTTFAPIDYSSFFSPARNQGSCGSCWAFSTTGAIEGALGLKQGTSYSYLSPQQLVDCDWTNFGCLGGYLQYSFAYAKTTGLELDSAYPYLAKRLKCTYNSTMINTKVKDYYYCSNYLLDKTKYCSTDRTYELLTYGPASVTIDGGAANFKSYKSGIFDSTCHQLTHAVILVGMGTDPTYGNFWIIRNSWGVTWGEEGYARIKLNSANKNSCFIEEQVWVPIV